MESFFLAETTKYLYLLFDEDNFMHIQGEGEIIETAYGTCLANAGAYIFNTEAHPIDMSALYCCHDLKEDIFENLDLQKFSDESLVKAEHERIAEEADDYMSLFECKNTNMENEKSSDSITTKKMKDNAELSVDIEVYDENNEPMGDALVHSFEKITKTTSHTNTVNVSETANHKQKKFHLTMEDLNKFFSLERKYFSTTTETLEFIKSFMGNFTINPSFVQKKFKSLLEAQERRTLTLWDLYVLHQRAKVNKHLAEKFQLLDDNEENVKILKSILLVLSNVNNNNQDNVYTSEISKKIEAAKTYFKRQLTNTTSMQEFVANIVITDRMDTFQYNILLESEEIESLPLPIYNYTLNEIFTNFQRSTELKLQMIETFERLQELILDKSNNNSTTEHQLKAPKEEVENAIKNIINMNTTINYTEQMTTDVEKKTTNKASVWQQLIQKIISTTISQPIKFDEQQLHKNVRKSMEKLSSQKYTVDDYELFSCPQQTFLERFSYRNYYPPTA